jgi:hypothetical protein
VADDERLLELLGQALAPEAAEPPPERVAAVRHLVEEATTVAPDTPASPARLRRPGRPGWGHRTGWLAAGVSVAAAAVVIALLTLPSVVGSGSGRHEASAPAGGTSPVVARLRVALLSGDPVTVARADANLLRQARTIAAPEQDDAVAAHVEAIQFLRDHPSPDAAAELPPPAVAPASETPPVPTTLTPNPLPGPGTGDDDPVPAVIPAPPVPTTVAPGPPDVTIVGVVPRLDATFQVDFTVSGFTPDASGAPGTHSVHFSFDDGQATTAWDGASPWSFPVTAGLTYRQVCAHVADAAGVEDLTTGGCHDIV